MGNSMKKLTLILAMLLSNVANAATFASAIVPYNGTYNNQTTTSCDLDSSYATPLSLTTAVDNVTTGQEIFTPDITHTSTVSSLDAFKTKWVPYVTGLTTFSPVITNPIPLLTATPDPTSRFWCGFNSANNFRWKRNGNLCKIWLSFYNFFYLQTSTLN